MTSDIFERQSQLTDASTVPRHMIARSYPGMAHFAGTAMNGQTCWGCGNYTGTKSKGVLPKNGNCLQFQKMMGKSGPKFPGDAQACKYFEAKKGALI